MESLELSVNTIWVLISAFLVMWMRAGFACLEAGLTRAKNTVNILMKNVATIAIGALTFFIVGYGLMFGDGNCFVGWKGFFLENTDDTVGHLPLYAFWFFQAVFCATAATIVSGAVAERIKFTRYLIFTAVITAVIYPVSGHWIWGGGWLQNIGFVDFAGSTAVHSVGGWAALAGCITLGPRIGKYNKNGTVNPIPGHNAPLATLGVLILLLGWFGFNGGSWLAANPFAISHIAGTTLLAAAAGGLSVTLLTLFKFGKTDYSMILNGILAGLVSITAGTASVSFLGAIVIGIIGGVIVVFTILFFEKNLKIDDAVGAVSVHGICGVWGTVAVGIFGVPTAPVAVHGLIAGGLSQLGIQSIGVLATFAWAFGTSLACLLLLKATMGIRVPEQQEFAGLDVQEHGISAYPDFISKGFSRIPISKVETHAAPGLYQGRISIGQSGSHDQAGSIT